MNKLIVTLFFLGFSFSCSHYNKEEMTYAVYDGTEVKGDLWLPSGNKRHPIVILLHGGLWNSRSKEDMDPIADTLVKKGFAVFNINYRLLPKYHFPAPLEDFMAAINFLKNNQRKFNLDLSRIGAWGYSSGAHTVVLGALKLEKELRIKAVVSGAGPMNLTLYPESKNIKRYLGADYQKNPQIFYEASPYFFLNSNSPPMFFYHSKQDRKVVFKHSEQMIKQLESLGVSHEFYQVPFLNHFFTFVLSFDSIEKGANFLSTHLK